MQTATHYLCVNYYFLCFTNVFFLSCSNLKQTAENKATPNLKLVSSLEIPFDKTFQNTKVGGLSGIDYDAKNDLYYFISDDRSMFNDSRFYTAKIRLVENKLESIDFQSVSTLKNETGKVMAIGPQHQLLQQIQKICDTTQKQTPLFGAVKARE